MLKFHRASDGPLPSVRSSLTIGDSVLRYALSSSVLLVAVWTPAHFQAPLWACAVSLVVGCVWCGVLALWVGDRARRRAIARRDRCPDCGYDLRGMTIPQCPECGVVFFAWRPDRELPDKPAQAGTDRDGRQP